MSRFFLLVVTASFVALPLYADIEGTAAGEVAGNGSYQQGAKVVVEVDPRWGYEKDDDLKQFRERNNGLPEVSGSAETTTDANGKYSVKLKVTVSENSKLPKWNFREGKVSVEKPYVILKITVTQDGFRKHTRRATLPENGYSEWAGSSMRSDLYATRTVTATLERSDGEPAGGVRIVGESWYQYEPRTTFELTADAKGRIEIADEFLANHLTLRVADEGLAFAHDAPAWHRELRGGENALGLLRVVPGSGVKLRSLSAETGKSVSVRYELRSTQPGSKAFVVGKNLEGGELQIAGIPEGEFQLTLNPEQRYLWYARFLVAIKQGQIVDLGDIKLEPEQTLDVFAADENGRTIEQYEVRMTLVPGTAAPFIVSRESGKDIYAGARCTAEKCTITNLVRGTWRVTVNAEGFSPGTAEIELPSDSPLTVTLVQGGGIEFQSSRGGQVGWQQIWVVSTEAPCYATISRMPAAEIQDAFDDGLDPTLVFPSPNGKRDRFSLNRGVLKPIPAGTYTVFMLTDSSGLVRIDGVSVQKGDTAIVVVKYDAPAEVTLSVTEQGAPKDSVALVAIPLDHSDRTKSVSARTDGNGSATLTGLAPGRYSVVTKEEFDWMSGQGSGFNGAQNVRSSGTAGVFRVSPGDRFDFAIELYDPGRIWLTVKVKLPSGKKIEQASIQDLYHGELAITERTVKGVNGTFEFGPVRAGTYEFFDGGFGDRKAYYKHIKVNQAPRQTIELDMSLSKLTVTLRIPKTFEHAEFHTYLKPYYEEPSMMAGTTDVGTRNKLARDKVEFSDVPEGLYLLTSWAEKWNPERGTISHSEVVEVTKNKKVTVKFDDDYTGISFKFTSGREYFAHLGFEGDERRLWVEVLNRKGERVMIDGRPVMVIRPDDLHGYRVEPGTYTVRLFGRGFEMQTFEDVDIKRGAGALLEVDLKPAATVHVQIPNIAPNALLLEEIKLEAFDKDGNVLATDSGGMKAIFQPRARRFPVKDENGRNRWNREEEAKPVCQLTFMNVPVRSTRIRVTVNGYKPLEIEVKPDLKQDSLHSVKIEKD